MLTSKLTQNQPVPPAKNRFSTGGFRKSIFTETSDKMLIWFSLWSRILIKSRQIFLIILFSPEYADFTDLTEQIYYPEDFHNAKINNQSISWTSGENCQNFSRIFFQTHKFPSSDICIFFIYFSAFISICMSCFV